MICCCLLLIMSKIPSKTKTKKEDSSTQVDLCQMPIDQFSFPDYLIYSCHHGTKGKFSGEKRLFSNFGGLSISV